MSRSKKASEFGGVPGRIQPLPHDVEDVASEEHRLMMATEPTDPSDTVAAARLREGNEIAPRNTRDDL